MRQLVGQTESPKGIPFSDEVRLISYRRSAKSFSQHSYRRCVHFDVAEQYRHLHLYVDYTPELYITTDLRSLQQRWMLSGRKISKHTIFGKSESLKPCSGQIIIFPYHPKYERDISSISSAINHASGLRKSGSRGLDSIHPAQFS